LQSAAFVLKAALCIVTQSICVFNASKACFKTKNKGKSVMKTDLPFQVEGSGGKTNLFEDLNALVQINNFKR